MVSPDLLAFNSYPAPPGVIEDGAPGFRRCARCVMDTTDPNIVFDEKGECNHCRAYDWKVRAVLGTAEQRADRLKKQVAAIKVAGEGKEYDCVIGVSGGVDSTYVAYLVKQLGLRPLAVHMDNGWNSELAVSNIQKTLDTLGIDLYTEVLDWDEFRDLQLSFLKASTPDSEIPTDHAITAVLMHVAKQHGVRYIINGSNVRTEAILASAWSQGIRDWKYIRSVHKRFGSVPLESFPHFTLWDFVRESLMPSITSYSILNDIEYSKTEAMRVLEQELGWKYYGGKHYESIYTRFFQAFILPAKFKADKRKMHLSTLICSDEITREAALEALAKPTADQAMLEEDFVFTVKKLGVTPEEFEQILRLPPKTIKNYPAYENSIGHDLLRLVYRAPRYIRSLRNK
ncbi:MAG: N-acetyl sugar amidotransferase [Rhodothermales bacterium]|nr:N-acetyl sugar amidotransferase [Rhodothermales bacterium]